MWIAVFNNLPELVLGITWSSFIGVSFWKLGRWWERRKSRPSN